MAATAAAPTAPVPSSTPPPPSPPPAGTVESLAPPIPVAPPSVEEAPMHWLDGRAGLRELEVGVHRWIEIVGMDSGVVYREEIVEDAKVPSLVEKNEPVDGAKWTFRLLASTPNPPADDVPLPYSPETFAAIQKYYHLAPLAFRHRWINACAVPFTPLHGPAGISWTGIRFSLTFPRDHTYAFSHNSETRTTLAVLYGEADRTFSRILSALQSMKTLAFLPCLIPFIMMETSLEFVTGLLNRTWDDFELISFELGGNEYMVPIEPDGDEAPDITEMPRKLTSIATTVADVVAYTDVLGRGVEHVERLLGESIQQEKSMATAAATAMDLGDGATTVGRNFWEDVNEMRDHVGLMQERVKFRRRKCDVLKESITAQVQMVYAILQQRDNEINHRYGADMRIIAAVTLIFLPGTFIATLFSTSFWDFGPKNSGAKVSKWVWLYFAVTAILTIIVLSFWRGYTALKQFNRTIKEVWRLSRSKRKKVKEDDEEKGMKKERERPNRRKGAERKDELNVRGLGLREEEKKRDLSSGSGKRNPSSGSAKSD